MTLPQQQYQLCQKILANIPKLNQKYGLSIEVESEKNYYEYFGFVDEELFAPEPRIYHRKEIVELSAKNKETYLELISDKSVIIGKLLCPEITEKQIRQILVGLQEVLGENPNWRSSKTLGVDLADAIDDIITERNHSRFGNDMFTIRQFGTIYAIGMGEYPSQAETLYKKWCYGFPTSLFDANPILVLTELVEILENLLK